MTTPSTASAKSAHSSSDALSVSVEHVSQVFETPGSGARLVLDDVSFVAEPGEFVCLVGASGCGKTTLLRSIAGLVRPSQGEVGIGAEMVKGPTEHCGFVFQSDSLMPWRTVNANVGLGLEVRGVRKGARREAIVDALGMVGLGNWGTNFPRELSGGMRQRVNIARALALKPSVLLMDEPFAAPDAQTREIMQTELLALCESLGITVVFVTHQIEEAVLIADRIIVLSASPGRVNEIVTPPFPRPRDSQVKRSPEFAETVDHIWQLIGHEVRRSVEDELGGSV